VPSKADLRKAQTKRPPGMTRAVAHSILTLGDLRTNAYCDLFSAAALTPKSNVADEVCGRPAVFDTSRRPKRERKLWFSWPRHSAAQPRAGDGGTQAEIGQVLYGFTADQRNDFGSVDSAGFGGGSSLRSQRLSTAASSACFWTERAFAYSVL
jgi:hypothetical protein